MQMTTKSGAVVFAHNDEFKGDVTITRGEAAITVPVDALRKFIAEAVRFDAISRIAAAKPETLLRGAA